MIGDCALRRSSQASEPSFYASPNSVPTSRSWELRASIQGESVRVSGAKRDVLQEAIALVRADVTDFPLQFGNFRD